MKKSELRQLIKEEIEKLNGKTPTKYVVTATGLPKAGKVTIKAVKELKGKNAFQHNGYDWFFDDLSAAKKQAETENRNIKGDPHQKTIKFVVAVLDKKGNYTGKQL